MRNPITLTTLILAALMAAPLLTAQTPPQAISYQALVRDGAGVAVRNQQVGVRIRLHYDSANTAYSYAETFTPTTNNFGNINLSIGRGNNPTSNFSAQDWSRPIFVEIGVDPNGGTAYVDLGTTQLLSVPYSLFSARSASTTNDADTDPTNEIQLLTLTNDTLHLSRNGGNVKLPVQPTPQVSEIRDTDGNTRVSTERSPNENIIRFDLNGTEKMRLRGNALELPNSGFSVYIGDSAGVNVSAGDLWNVFVGDRAGRSNTAGYFNTFAGSEAGRSNTTGSFNTFSGSSAGYSNRTGNNNTFAGYAAGAANTTGATNTFAGSQAGVNNTTGTQNTFAGYAAGYHNTTGNFNTFAGQGAGYYNTTGNSNTYLGNSAGPNSLSRGGDSGNVFIGYQAGFNDAITGSNKLAIANSGTATPLIYGDFSTNFLTINGTLASTGVMIAPAFITGSDRRLKENIQPVSNALDGVGKINGVYYTYKAKAPDGNPYPQSRQIGVIAQDVEKVYPELVAVQPGGYKAVDYPKLTAVLIEAVKEQQRQKVELERKFENRFNEMAFEMKLMRDELKLSRMEREGAKVAKR